ncbi:MAG: Rieske 2Fe-2S domain-containing protein [Phycisphaerae bacterium]|nr:Rieske 2Fe-2S domain-containing protein [Phycisphaerae bacterium]
MRSSHGAAPEWVYTIDVTQAPPGSAVRVQVGEQSYAICNDAGRFVVVGNLCPHAQGSLGRGEVANGCVICPVHRWPWNLRTGLTDPDYPHMRLTFYRHEIREGKVYVDVSTPVAPEHLGWGNGPAASAR